MVAERVYTAADRLQMDRDAAICEIGMTTAGLHGLSSRVEQDIRSLLGARLLPILDAADALVEAAQELEAIDRRLDNHVEMHLGCMHPRPCRGYRVLQLRRRLSQRTWDRAWRRLAGGG